MSLTHEPMVGKNQLSLDTSSVTSTLPDYRLNPVVDLVTSLKGEDEQLGKLSAIMLG